MVKMKEVTKLTTKKYIRLNLETGEKTPLSKHAAPVRCIVYSKDHSMRFHTMGANNLLLARIAGAKSSLLISDLSRHSHLRLMGLHHQPP